MPANNKLLGHKLVIAVIVLIMLTPIAATLLYSLSTRWGAGT